VKILMVDDHHLVRDGLRPVLEQLATPSDPATVFEASSYASAIERADEHPDIDLVVLDLHLPDVAGFAALADLQERHPGLPIVVMSGEDDPALMRQAIDYGALGFIPKSSTSAVILNALRLVLSGGTYLPREIMWSAAPPAQKAPAALATPIPAGLDITPRQADVLALLLTGKSNKVICRELNLAESTVKNHVAAVFRALNVTSRVQAVLAASRLGIKY
jgi:DNA-binding NarL/FixJ family response regulator